MGDALAVLHPEAAILVPTFIIVPVTPVYQQKGQEYNVGVGHDVHKQGRDRPAQSKQDFGQIVEMSG